MRCASVFYLSVVTIFGVAYSLRLEPCVYGDYYGEKAAYCRRRDDDNKTLDFIPPISQNITYISLRGHPLKQLPHNGFRNLSSQSNISVIWLLYCQISHVDAAALLNVHNLTIINLSHNDISQIDSRLFSDTKHIEYIYMSHNKIEVVPSGLFQNLALLEVVDLQHNQIHRVERFSFKNTPSLRIIDLSTNQIEFMNMLFTDKFDNLTHLWTYGNPWKCNCELGPLYEFLIKRDQLNLYALVCDKPSTLHGRNWMDISRDEFVCRSADDTVPVTVYHGTRRQQDGPGVPQPPSDQSWIPRRIPAPVFVGAASVIIVVAFLVRYARRRPVRSNRRTNALNIPMRVIYSSAGSDDSD